MSNRCLFVIHPTDYGKLWNAMSEAEQARLTAVSNKYGTLAMAVGRHGIILSPAATKGAAHRVQLNGKVEDLLAFSASAIEAVTAVTVEDVHKEIKS